jgi:hypothetical protein
MKNPLTDLSAGDCEHLPAFVVAARGTGRVSLHTASALAAFGERWGMPPVCSLARAQAHLGHLAFRNSHISWSC